MDKVEFAVRRLREQLPALTLLEHEPMNRHCSFRIGGPVRALVQPASAEEAASRPRTARPRSTRAPGQAAAMASAVAPRPLPSWVQMGRMVLPEKS